MTTENSMKFVELAVSKDQTRYNLCGMYRDKKHLVGTDGHRIHFANGLPEIETGHYLNGIDAQFPDWNQVLPKVEPVSVFILKLDKDVINFLSGVKVMDKDTKAQRISLELADGGLLRFHYSGQLGVMSAFYSHTVFEVSGPTFEVGFNVHYLLDVLAFNLKHNRYLPIVKCIYYGEGHPVLFETIDGTAGIMPLRK